MIAKIKSFWPYVFLTFIVFVISAINYQAGTYLTGWDNLNPEFNFTLNIQRSIFSVWQEYQGLGLIGGLAYAADLPRQLLLWGLSLVFPVSVLRYVSTYAMLLLGPIGMYVLLYHGVLGHIEDNKRKIISFLGALFYLFNLATVQVFYVPFEAFVYHFGFLPWLVYVYLRTLNSYTRRNILLFTIVNFLAIPQGYVPTIFVVYMLTLALFTYASLVIKKDKIVFSRAILLSLIIFIVNAFWFLPFIYYTFSHSAITVSSHMSAMSTEDIYARNKMFGNFLDVAMLKGFSFNYVDPDTNGNYSFLMLPWKNYYASIFVQAVSYIFFGVILTGLVSTFKQKDKWLMSLGVVFIFAFIMLASDTIPFSWIDEFLRRYVPLFSQIFRVTFTKFGTLAGFSYSIFFAVGLYTVYSFIEKRIEREQLRVNAWKIFAAGVIVSLFVISFPLFQGNLFYSKVRVNIPSEYFSLMSFFERPMNAGRIMILPQYTYWGWGYSRWGYGGSGFQWYGITQPTMDRAFDGYSDKNENYYWELSRAIYSGDAQAFEDILQKYNIGWIMLDYHIFNPGSSEALYNQKLTELLRNSSRIQLARAFGSVNLYRVNTQSAANQSVFMSDKLSAIVPASVWNNNDKAYIENGNYITGLRKEGQVDIYYPYRSLFTGRRQEDLEFEIEDKGEYFSFTSTLPKSLAGMRLVVPPTMQHEVTEINIEDLDNTVQKQPQIYIDGELVNVRMENAEMQQYEVPLTYIKEGKLEVRVPKIFGYYSANYESGIMNHELRSCDNFNKGEIKHEKITEDGKEWLRLTSVGSSNCLDFGLPNLVHRLPYLVTVESKRVQGKSLLFALINKNSERADIETYLPKAKGKGQNSKTQVKNQNFEKSYFVVPPMELYGVGYTIHLDNISIGRDKTVNDLGKITVNPIPYSFLTGLKIVKPEAVFEKNTSSIAPKTVDHPNASFYEAEFNNATMQQCNKENATMDNATMQQCKDLTLVLSQSYDDGWKAYEISQDSLLLDSWYSRLFIPLFRKEIKDHVMVNNWANGWQLNNAGMRECKNGECTIVIIYLPQYLEYFGFVLLGGTILYFLYSHKKITSNN